MTTKLTAALADLLVAHSELEKAKAQYDGYSWDYAGRYVIDAFEKAEAAYITALDEHIDTRILMRGIP